MVDSSVSLFSDLSSIVRFLKLSSSSSVNRFRLSQFNLNSLVPDRWVSGLLVVVGSTWYSVVHLSYSVLVLGRKGLGLHWVVYWCGIGKSKIGGFSVENRLNGFLVVSGHPWDVNSSESVVLFGSGRHNLFRKSVSSLRKVLDS